MLRGSTIQPLTNGVRSAMSSKIYSSSLKLASTHFNGSIAAVTQPQNSRTFFSSTCPSPSQANQPNFLNKTRQHLNRITSHSLNQLDSAAGRSFGISRFYSSEPENGDKESTVIDAKTIPEKPKEEVVGDSVKREFQAETRKLLDIVANSLYSEKEVFVREVISNASDALEKLRYLQSTEQDIVDKDVPLEIRITADAEKRLFIVQDTGIGMTEAELVKNLGTIAHSGSKAFVQQNSDKAGSHKENIIGQFGVGFYSTFMVGDTVTVYSRSATVGSKGFCWKSDGSGTYDIAEASNVERGTKIVVHLKEEAKDYSMQNVIEQIIKKYSNFVGFPILLNGERVNTLQPLWMRDSKSITEEEHTEFYRFISDGFDSPTYTLQYSVDSPINIRSIFYVPQTNIEKLGFGRLEAGVSLYSRKVLIQQKTTQLLPEWMRFVKGVVDSEDLPLNLSREMLQNNLLFGKLKNVLVGRIIRFLDEQSKKDADKYQLFYKEFGNFIREGVVVDHANRPNIAKLLRFESSRTEAGKEISLDEYITRSGLGENDDAAKKVIYYICVPNRETAEKSPYFESFKGADKPEVLFGFQPLDDITMSHLTTYNGFKTVSIESSKVNISDETVAEEQWSKDLATWLKTTLGDTKVNEVKISNRLVEHPAIVVDHESASMRRMSRMIDPGRVAHIKATLEINPKHPIMTKLNVAREKNPELASSIAAQVYDNALIAAGLLDDPRVFVERVNKIMEKALDSSA